MQFSKIKDALEYVGGFSAPSKMPCPSYSIPASACKVGAKLILDAIRVGLISICFGDIAWRIQLRASNLAVAFLALLMSRLMA